VEEKLVGKAREGRIML